MIHPPDDFLPAFVLLVVLLAVLPASVLIVVLPAAVLLLSSI